MSDAEKHFAFAVVLGQTDYFAREEFDVVYVKVRSIRLHLLNALLPAFADNMQAQSFYVPHITVAYVKPGKDREYAAADFLAGRIVSVTELVFSNQYQERTVIKLIDVISVS